jgi:hypothetical protein
MSRLLGFILGLLENVVDFSEPATFLIRQTLIQSLPKSIITLLAFQSFPKMSDVVANAPFDLLPSRRGRNVSTEFFEE